MKFPEKSSVEITSSQIIVICKTTRIFSSDQIFFISQTNEIFTMWQVKSLVLNFFGQAKLLEFFSQCVRQDYKFFTGLRFAGETTYLCKV